MAILVTGAAGFIGFHVARALLDRGHEIIGVDNLNPYYDVALKEARLGQLRERGKFQFVRLDLADRDPTARLFADEHPPRVIHLAAQAGVRYAASHPHAYADSNLVAFLNVLEGCRSTGVEHLVFASTSSVYGANARTPFSEHHGADHPLSLYAATKRANELMAHAYAHLYGLPTTGLRFFTVYGPWGRPDMSLFQFTGNILAGKPIEVFNNGDHARDFTYIDDAAEAVLRVLDRPPKPDPDWSSKAPDPASSSAPFRIFNIGNNAVVPLMELIACIEAATGKTAAKTFLPMQPGDVPTTHADVMALEEAIGFRPRTPLAEGVRRFVEWYRAHYKV